MSDTPEQPQQQLDPYAEPTGRRFHWGGIWLGLVVSGGASFGAFWFGVDGNQAMAATALVLGTLVAAAISFAAGFRSFALGLVSGYAVMTIISGGACTLRFGDPLEDDEAGTFIGFMGYPVFVFVFGIVAAVVHARRKKV